jgi:hypothetical protein
MDLNQIGHDSLRAFVNTVRQVINNGRFDFILAASDSGQLATYITEEVYRSINNKTPRKLVAPIYRHIDKERTILFDNTILTSQFSKWQDTVLGNTLFVDDEIWRAATLNGMFDLLSSLGIKMRSCTIVAEDGGFHCPHTIHGVHTHFIPTKRRIPDIYNALSYTIPGRYRKPVKEALSSETGLGYFGLNDKQVMCTLLGLPIKEWNNGMPQFTERLIQKVEKEVPQFSILQTQYKKWLGQTIQKYLAA